MLKVMQAQRKIAASIGKFGILGAIKVKAIDIIVSAGKTLTRYRDHHTRYSFTDRSSKKDTLIIILAGYKPYLWSATITRIHKLAPNDADVCVACSGIDVKELADMCSTNGWSYLSTKRNSPGVAVNTALSLHPAAEYIYKIDEDIVISNNLFAALRDGYASIWRETSVEPGFCAPVLNVNGITYLAFLATLGVSDEYISKFGTLIKRCDGVPIHNNADAAYWIWQHSLPFDQRAASFAAHKGQYSACYTRFSIGVIFLTRRFLHDMGGFASSWYPGVLGVDEDCLCRACVSRSRPMYVVEDTLAGHFSFYPQERFMRTMLPMLSRADPETFPPPYFDRDADSV